jgi:hypothetical protein
VNTLRFGQPNQKPRSGENMVDSTQMTGDAGDENNMFEEVTVASVLGKVVRDGH